MNNVSIPNEIVIIIKKIINKQDRQNLFGYIATLKKERDIFAEKDPELRNMMYMEECGYRMVGLNKWDVDK